MIEGERFLGHFVPTACLNIVIISLAPTSLSHLSSEASRISVGKVKGFIPVGKKFRILFTLVACVID